PACETAAWCSDAGVLAPVCGQTVVWGPGSIAQAHTADEFIERDSLKAGTETLRRFLRHLASEPAG
ncbi:MAG: M20/M25/M40 family metallo-hydrolase, partial [Kiritimatiellae bacterium]|nr:M20/M25/M40 family metallo-hydrolase [Kiritimatiellia bacterium]